MDLNACDVSQYHVHIYFQDGEERRATQLRDEAGSAERIIGLGRMHSGPVGPHPMRQFQLLVPTHHLDGVLEWLNCVRGELSVLIHPDIEDDLMAHTTFARWLGRPIELDLARFA